jgi:hypothetical protein
VGLWHDFGSTWRSLSSAEEAASTPQDHVDCFSHALCRLQDENARRSEDDDGPNSLLTLNRYGGSCIDIR